MNNILAKSSGESLVVHVDKTLSLLDEYIKIYNIILTEEDYYILRTSLILHDIGKIENGFQKYLKTGKSKFKNYHHIFSWAFIVQYLDINFLSEISNLVLWHHGNESDCSDLSSYDIIKQLSDSEIKLMKEFCDRYSLKVLETPPTKQRDNKTNFHDIDNYLRTLLIFIDANASSAFTYTEELPKDIKYIDSFMNSERTQTQLSIVNDIKDNNTNLIKAPAGFGKTIIVLLWFLRRNKKLIWVTPTNTIATEVYNNIISDLKMICQNEISVELYLSSERIDSTHNNIKDFCSDIVVTNIDNFIKPSRDNSFANRSFSIYTSDVVFDEVHELNTLQCALLQSFNNIMKKRHEDNITTILLTATPTVFYFADTEEFGTDKKIISLPNIKEHYKAVHKEKYIIKFVTIDSYKKELDNLKNEKNVFFLNRVVNVQSFYDSDNNSKMICHGLYLEDDKKSKKERVFDNLGKRGKHLPTTLYTNQMLTTACDYSAQNMFIKNPTFEMFFQSLGRVNRWGENKKISNIYIIDEMDRGDKKFLDNRQGLQSIFINELRKKFENIEVDLDTLYLFYNDFLIRNEDGFCEVLRKNLKESEKYLKEIYPKRPYKGFEKNENPKANSNMWRKSENSEIYISVPSDNDDRVVIKISMSYDKEYLFDEDDKTFLKQMKIYKTLYNKYKKTTPEKMLKNACNYESPYPVFNHIYCKDKGLYKI